MDDALEEEQGWKNLHTDVFRFPAYKSLMCAVLGNGMQFLALCFGLILLALGGMFSVHHHGSFNTAGILLYALTCFISGCVSKRINYDTFCHVCYISVASAFESCTCVSADLFSLYPTAGMSRTGSTSHSMESTGSGTSCSPRACSRSRCSVPGRSSTRLRGTRARPRRFRSQRSCW